MLKTVLEKAVLDILMGQFLHLYMAAESGANP